MAFIQPCFIRKNTPEIINRLKALRIPHNDYDNGDRPWIAFNYGMWISVDEGHNKLFPDDIDCGENEELFLALATLRDDNDYMQWFTDGKSWYQDKVNDIEVLKYGAGKPIDFHKATVEEIIEHFKDR